MHSRRQQSDAANTRYDTPTAALDPGPSTTRDPVIRGGAHCYVHVPWSPTISLYVRFWVPVGLGRGEGVADGLPQKSARGFGISPIFGPIAPKGFSPMFFYRTEVHQGQ